MATGKEGLNGSQGAGTWDAIKRHGRWFLLAAALFSLLFHVLSYVQLGRYATSMPLNFTPKNAPVKIRIVQQPPKKPEVKQEKPTDDPDKMPKILETPQTKTERPDESSYVGVTDHKAKKETRVSEKLKREKAKDAGQKGNPEIKPEAPLAQNKPEQLKEQKNPKQSDIKVGKSGSLAMDSFSPKPRNNYEALLPRSVNDLPGQIDAGFQDYVDDKIQEGDRIDINTSEYRYIGYFTNMRKAIELVWTYPMEAARKGIQGEVGLEFAIGKDGRTSRIRVIKSSGYEVLDKAIIEAIKLASPFSPLPTGFGREKIVVTGSFRYILSAYGSH